MNEPIGRTARTGEGRNRRRPEQPVSAESYYGMPVLNPPVWEEREIAGYLFLGGLSGASSILAAVADLSGASTLADRSRLAASAGISLSLLALVKDLGRPQRFLNMLRVFKPTSPMSVGTWVLSVYAPLSFLSSASSLTGRGRAVGRWTGVSAGLGGSLVATYTAALISDTAVPAWHDGHRELPFLFAGSSAMAAGGLGLLTAPHGQSRPAWRLALIGAGAELFAERLYEQRLGATVAESLHTDAAGRRLKRAQRLATGGAALVLALGRRNRLAAGAGGTALLTASALTRFGIFAAGMQSACEPRHTVEPQRERVNQRKGQT